MGNTASYTSAAKPRIAGGIYRAAKTATAPTSADASLDPAVFTCLGYVSEDGLVNSIARETDTKKAWGGDTVLIIQNDFTDSFQFSLLEVLNKDVLGTVHGESNITGTDLDTGIKVTVNSSEPTEYMWVFDMIMNEGVLNRLVIPCARVQEVGDITYSSSDLVEYDVTITAIPDASGNTHYEYKKAAPIVTT